MIIHDVDQYSPEWWALREGLPTASEASKILTPTGRLSAQSNGYINTLIADSMGLGDPPVDPTEWMIRGHELEPEARQFLTFERGLEVEEVGFCTDDDGLSGCSPDGLVGRFINRGGQDSAQVGVEIKCPKASTMIGYLRENKLPDYYRPQVHFSMAVTNIRRWIFMAYHPDLRPLVVDVEWDDYTDQVSSALGQFIINLAHAKQELDA